MKISVLGGLHAEHDGRAIHVAGTMQVAVLFRLAIDAGTSVSYRAIAEDIWAMDAPENVRASLQSIVSRLRAQLPAGMIESVPGGYRMAIARSDVDALAFQDFVAAASMSTGAAASTLASKALVLWRGEPWTPSENFDWFLRDLLADRTQALELGGVAGIADVTSAIPAPLTGLVGRERELAMIADQLGHNRLVTIIGTGGAGKTRLAVESARARGGAVLVELAPVGANEVLSAVLAATGRDIRTGDARTEIGTRDRVFEALGGRDVLLVLDNCEHVIDAAAAVAIDLLGSLPNLRILATSREPLGLLGEGFVVVGSLDQEQAVQLFLQRAASATGADLAERDVETAAQICERLDGLPLAIELAAARLRTMSAAEVLAGLQDRFALLTGGFRTTLPRHQTLRAMIDWSWGLLSEGERSVLSQFSVYPAGADAKDVGAIAHTMDLASASDFDALVDRSLLQRRDGRYRQLETIREYGIERLVEVGGLADARLAQLRYMVASAEHYDPLLRGPSIHEALAWFDAEEDNIAASLRYATSVGLADEAVGLTISCFWYWTIRQREEDSRLWMTAIAPLAGRVNTDAARLVHLVAPLVLAFDEENQPDDDDGMQIAAALGSLPLFEVTRDSQDILQLVIPLIAAFASEMDSEGWMTRVNVPRGEDLGLSAWPTAVLDVVRAAIAQNRGEIEALGESSALAVAEFTEIGDYWGLAMAQQMRSEWLSARGQLEEALELTEASTGNLGRITSEWDLAQQAALAVSVLIRLGRVDAARERVETLLSESDASGNVRTIAQMQCTAATAFVALADAERAREHLARYDEVSASIPHMPLQMTAAAEAARAGIALLDGDTDAAEVSLRAAADAALASHDHPVIGAVALQVGMLGLARGNVAEALSALELSTAILGVKDPTDLRVIAIESAALNAGTGRVGALPTRPVVIESLLELLP